MRSRMVTASAGSPPAVSFKSLGIKFTKNASKSCEKNGEKLRKHTFHPSSALEALIMNVYPLLNVGSWWRSKIPPPPNKYGLIPIVRNVFGY